MMDVDLNFDEYLAKFGQENENSESDEEGRLEREAELYRSFHYQEENDSSKALENDPDITENLSLNLLNDLLTQQSQEEPSKYSDTKKAEILISSDSEDDSGIQIISETEPLKPKIIDLDSNSDSEIEHFPTSTSKKRLVIEAEKETAEIRPKFKPYIDDSSSDSSCQEIEIDEEDIQDLHLNVKGQRVPDFERNFDQVIGEKSYQKSESETKWTPEMRDFYNEIDPQNADITLEKIFRDLPDDPDLWRVKKSHATPNRTPNRYFHGRHCTNCNRDGHNSKSCPEPKRRMLCIMCRTEGHTYFHCPDAHCLRCGNPGEPFSENCRKCRYLDTMDCRLCGGRGHIQNQCSDIWRRYHATLKKGQPLEPKKSVHLPATEVWCCNCGKKGHLVHQCRAYSYSCVPPLVTSVISYKEPQQFDSRPESRSVKKRRLREELKASKRAYQSLPCTPKIGKNQFRSQPATPILNFQNNDFQNKQSQFSVLNGAKNHLENLLEAKKARKNKKRQKKWAIKLNLDSSPDNSMISVIKEKLAQSRNCPNGSAETKMARKKVMKELKFMKRNSGQPVEKKKMKKLNRLLSKI